MKFLLDFYLDFNTVHAERSRIFLLSELKPSLFELFKRAFEKSQIVGIYLKRGLRSNAFGDVANAHCEIKTSFISLAQSQHSHTVTRYAHRKLRLSESKGSLLALPSGSRFVKQNLF